VKFEFANDSKCSIPGNWTSSFPFDEAVAAPPQLIQHIRLLVASTMSAFLYLKVGRCQVKANKFKRDVYKGARR